MRVKRSVSNPKHTYCAACQTGTVIQDGRDGYYMVRWDDGGKSMVAKDLVKVIPDLSDVNPTNDPHYFSTRQDEKNE